MPPAACESLEEIREASRQLMRANEANPDPNTGLLVASANAARPLMCSSASAAGSRFLSTCWRPTPTPTPTISSTTPANRRAARSIPSCSASPLCTVSTAPLRAGSSWPRRATRSGCVSARRPRPELAQDPRFVSAAGRSTHEAALIDALAQLFATRSAAEWEAWLAPHRIGCVAADAASAGAVLRPRSAGAGE